MRLVRFYLTLWRDAFSADDLWIRLDARIAILLWHLIAIILLIVLDALRLGIR